MSETHARALLIAARACAEAMPALAPGLAERKNLLITQRLLVRTWIEMTVLPEQLVQARDGLRNRQSRIAQLAGGTVGDLIANLSASNDLSIDDAPAIRTALAEAAAQLRASGDPEAQTLLWECLTLERTIDERLEEAYQTQIGRLLELGQTGAPSSIDIAPMAAFLSEIAGAPVTIESARRVPGGFSKTTMILNLGAGTSLPSSVVVRIDRAGSYLNTCVSDEYAIIKALHENGVRVPRPIATEPTGDVLGSPFIVVEALSGATIGDMFNRPPASGATNRAVATELAKLHSVPLDAMGDALRGRDITTRDQAAGWLQESRAAWEALPVRSAIMDAGFDWLARNLHLAEATPVVMHGDLGLNNILIADDDVTALLDWEFVCAGAAGYDIGYFHCMSIWLGDWNDFLSAYVAAGGVLPSPEAIDFFILFANVRLATMVWQGATAFNGGQLDDIIWSNPGSNDQRIATMRVADQLRRVTAGQDALPVS